jgi:cytochrome c oxidase assembly factor CtaG
VDGKAGAVVRVQSSAFRQCELTVVALLYSIPSVVLLLAAIAIAVTTACAGQTYVHRRFSDQDFVQHNEVGGFIIAVVGTLYAVVLGFLTIVVWQHFRAERERVILESAAADDAWHTAVGLLCLVKT